MNVIRTFLLITLLCLPLLTGCDSAGSVIDNTPPSLLPDRTEEAVLDAPIRLSHTPGVYYDPIVLTAESTDPSLTVRYTASCRMPWHNSPVFTEMPMAYQEQSSANGSVTAYTLRLAAYDDDGNQVGSTVTATYLFPVSPDRFTTRIVSVVCEPDDLYGSEGIISHKGQHGKEGERPSHVEFFSPDGSLSYTQNLGIRLNGAWARNMAQKNFRFFARKEYTPTLSHLEYPLIPGLRSEVDGTQIDSFDSFIIRGGATNFGNSMITSPIAYEMMEGSAVDAGNFEAVTMFLNGKYYGLMMYLEDYDPYYFESHYGVDSDEITTIQYTIVGGDPLTNWEADDCTDEEFAEWARVRNFLARRDMRKEENYRLACSYLDIDNFIEYLVFNCYADNWDWPRNNQRIWRYHGVPDGENEAVGGYDPDAPYGFDGRWRFVIKDLDISHGVNCEPELNYASRLETNFFQVLNKDSWSNNDLDLVLASLMKNRDFCRRFVLYVCEFLSTVAAPEEHLDRINAIALQVSTEMLYHHAYFDQSLDYYSDNLQIMRRFAALRPAIVAEDVNEYLRNNNFSHRVIRVTVEAGEGGSFHYNNGSFSGTTELYALSGLPLTMTVTPDPGYALSRVEMQRCSWNDGKPIFDKEGAILRLIFAPIPGYNPPTPDAHPVINEVGHSGKESVNGHDWIELYNPSSEPISLGGYALSDGKHRYALPNLPIEPHSFRLLFLSGGNEGGVYLPFTVSSGDTVTLIDPKGEEIDRALLLTRDKDAHVGRFPDGGEWVELLSLTVAAPNTYDAEPRHTFDEDLRDTVVINAVPIPRAFFTVGEDGDLSLSRDRLSDGSLDKKRSNALGTLFRGYWGKNNTIRLSEWAEAQDNPDVAVYYYKARNVYLINHDGIMLEYDPNL